VERRYLGLAWEWSGESPVRVRPSGEHSGGGIRFIALCGIYGPYRGYPWKCRSGDTLIHRDVEYARSPEREGMWGVQGGRPGRSRGRGR